MEAKLEEKPEVKEEVKVKEELKTPSAKEILARSQGKSQETSDITVDDIKASIKLDDIKDPIARQLAEKRIKDLESGFNKKYEQLANLRKDYESKISQQESWTQEKLDRALKDPAFVSLVQARQQIAQANQPPAGFEGSSDEWSALTPEEKHQFAQLNQKVQAQEQFMVRMLQTQEDEKLKQQYPDYDSALVDKIQQDLMSGRMQASREHLWKVANFETAIERAYRLGLEDRKLQMDEKINASSNPSVRNVTPNSEVPEEIRKKGFSAIGRWRLEQFKSGRK